MQETQWQALSRRSIVLAFSLGLSLFASDSLARSDSVSSATQMTDGVEIRRTTDGIPHLRAGNWRDLGTGVGYVQAQDALCTLAEAFVTYEGRRAWFFGAEARPARDSTFGRPKNIDLDFFFRSFADETLPARYRSQHPPELNDLIDGYAAGYNRYLADARAGRVRDEGRTCLNEPWVRAITSNDIYRRIYSAQIAAGYSRFIAEIANARPAGGTVTPAAGAVSDPGDAAALRARLAQQVGEQPGLGSNMLAFGQQATGEKGAVLFGNPHWYWGGPDRFYQMHLTIPGRLNVAGVAFLGVPVIMIGFNEHVAWSHTVSAARRFGLFDLTLDAKDPTRYRIDGKTEPMSAREVNIDTRGEDGGVRRITRTLYRTRFGPVVDLSTHDAAFGWSKTRALALRDVNAENFRIFRNFFYWNQARSLDEFIAIQRREAAVPWVNTAAIGRGDGRVWYGDVGAAPNVPDDLRKACMTPLASGFARIDPLTPFLDASRSACDWRSDPAAVQPGAMPASAQPWLLREDYVANMNDSYWLSNAHQPLEGFPSVLGGERMPLELRGRLGHRIALDLLRKPPGSTAILSRRLMSEVLTPRAYSAELFKEELLAQACLSEEVELAPDTLKEMDSGDAAQPPVARKFNIAEACRVLRRWSNQADAEDRGALLWEAFWTQLRTMQADGFYRVPFSSNAPLDTPRKPQMEGTRAAQALAAAVLALKAEGVEPDAPLGSRRFVESGGQRLPIYGGCHSAGYFTVACSHDGSHRLGPDTLANSYLQVVRFCAEGAEAHTLLAHGQDESAVANGRGSEPVARYARKEWLRFPFREADIARDPALARTVLRP
ncbi:penicillin acylase family protein [Noviherbaspirillum aerium]|uniref:penicillin acylase family protein n=1 Tax=Noviherbaspirillum aerium TaxID=2588497 RepID=UPI001CEF7EDF|nr:penicillin acylase family protein [Noviherbaspirillum aerium]